MSKPLVAIVGRPNVGKSTIINGLAQKRVSIVEDIPGVTRDRIYCDVRWLDREFTMIDTGGIEFRDEADQISDGIRQQAQLAMEEADVILLSSMPVSVCRRMIRRLRECSGVRENQWYSA